MRHERNNTRLFRILRTTGVLAKGTDRLEKRVSDWSISKGALNQPFRRIRVAQLACNGLNIFNTSTHFNKSSDLYWDPKHFAQKYRNIGRNGWKRVSFKSCDT